MEKRIFEFLKPKGKEMTLKEIEEMLGFKIKLKEEEN